jgi:hypothetical protein
MGRGREGPQKFLGEWEGILQTDGYQAYEGVGGPKLIHVGCWAPYPVLKIRRTLGVNSLTQ